jgi:hypothetical protein
MFIVGFLGLLVWHRQKPLNVLTADLWESFLPAIRWCYLHENLMVRNIFRTGVTENLFSGRFISG